MALANLALACRACNSHKGTAIDASDPESSVGVPLFNPRTQRWDEHFRLDLMTAEIEGLTAIGRATVRRLAMNTQQSIRARRTWISYLLLP